jgi:hypothetical protein
MLILNEILELEFEQSPACAVVDMDDLMIFEVTDDGVGMDRWHARIHLILVRERSYKERDERDPSVR